MNGNYSVMAILDSYADGKIAVTEQIETKVIVSGRQSNPLPTPGNFYLKCIELLPFFYLGAKCPKITGIGAFQVGVGQFISGCGEHYNIFDYSTSLTFAIFVEGQTNTVRCRWIQYNDPNQFDEFEVQAGTFGLPVALSVSSGYLMIKPIPISEDYISFLQLLVDLTVKVLKSLEFLKWRTQQGMT